ncbi:MAG: T9SS type A sorting domain-containing protein [Bacteroidia bacterium]|nr:T9SS type A sorting domain-containing protein [Bacteroidia bacterium]
MNSTTAFTFTANFCSSTLPWGPPWVLPAMYNPVPVSVPATGASWVHVTVPFSYCDANSGNYMHFAMPLGKTMNVDNLQLTDITASYPLSVSAGAAPNPICSGTPSVLSAAVTNPLCNVTYNWSPSTDLSSATVSNPTATPVTTTTYNLIVNDGCRTASSSVTLTVGTPTPVTVIPVPVLCETDQYNLSTSVSPSGGFFTGPGVTALGLFDATLTGPGTYVIVYTYTDAGGCSSSANITVYVQNCSCTTCITPLAPGGTLSSSPPASQFYCVNNNITVTGIVNINLSELQIAPNKSITVAPGAVLTIAGSHLYSCSGMWDGIIVQNGGSVKLIPVVFFGLTIRTTMIEDAKVGVDVLASTLTSNILTSDRATFNRNNIGVRISNYTLTSSTTYPFTVVNSAFTCRDIPFVPGSIAWPLTTTIKAATNPITSPLETPYIHNVNYPQTGATAFLKLPYAPSTTKSFAGMVLTNVGFTANPHTSSPTYYEVFIGQNGKFNYNIFDNLIYGISGENANLTVTSSIFQNTIGTGKGGGVGSIGIDVTSKELNHRLRVMPGTPSGNFNDRFFDCARAVNSVNYFENIITFTDVRSTQINTAPVTLFNHRGSFGHTVTSNRFRIMNVSDNELYNIESGIIFNANFGPYNIGGVFVSALGQYSGQVDVNRNIVNAHLPANPITTQYVRNAIRLSNVISSGIFSIPGTNVNCNSNSITSVHRGILTQNWDRKNIVCNSNTVSIVPDPFFFFPNPTQYGIGHFNNNAATSFGNTTISNTITGPGIFTNLNMRSILVSLCNNNNVRCNNTSATTNGIEFSGNNPNTSFRINYMSNCKYGFVLSNNGIIGTQGGPASPSDNLWTGAWTGGNFKTYTLTGSSSQNSKLYIRSGGFFNPNLSGTTGGIVGVEDYTIANGSLITTIGPIFLGCPIQNNGNGNGTPKNAIVLLEKIAQDQIPLTVNTSETQFISKNQLYRLLKSDPSLKDSSVVLLNFYNQSQQSIRESLSFIEDQMATGNITAGQIATNNLPTQGNIENNYKNFFNLHIRHQTNTFSGTDSSTLVNLANGCPFTDGAVVYQARALHNSIYNTAVLFEDNCAPASGSSRMASEKPELGGTGFDVLVYPNPSEGSISIVPFNQEAKDLIIVITDIQGKTIFNNKLPVNERLATLRLDVPDGMYLMNISDARTGESVSRKIIIQK